MPWRMLDLSLLDPQAEVWLTDTFTMKDYIFFGAKFNQIVLEANPNQLKPVPQTRGAQVVKLKLFIPKTGRLMRASTITDYFSS